MLATLRSTRQLIQTSVTKHYPVTRLRLEHRYLSATTYREMAFVKRKADVLTGSEKDLKRPKKDASLTSFFGPPKVSPAAKSASNAESVKFDKEKWAASLSEEQRKLLKLEIDTLDASWLAHLKDEVTSREFLDLKRFLQKEIDSGAKVFPPLEDVYSWSRHTPLNTVRVVILGQDPYHNDGQAHGLCFSVRPPTPAPPSLKNMFVCLKNDYPSFQPPPNRGGLLTPWADQGVLLINTCLTVRAHEANSHSNKGWEKFTQKVIDTVVKVRSRGVVFLAWGSPAQKRCVKITGAKHLVLKSVHPSPLSAHKGFMDCGHFKKTNEWLEERYGVDGTINWDLNVKKDIKGPKTSGPVKATEDQKVTSKASPATSPVTKTPSKNYGQPSRKADEFEDDDDDEDAIAVLEEMAKNDTDADGEKIKTVSPDATQEEELKLDAKKEDVEKEDEDKENARGSK